MSSITFFAKERPDQLVYVPLADWYFTAFMRLLYHMPKENRDGDPRALDHLSRLRHVHHSLCPMVTYKALTTKTKSDVWPDHVQRKSNSRVTTQSTSSSALQAFPYSDAIMKRPE